VGVQADRLEARRVTLQTRPATGKPAEQIAGAMLATVPVGRFAEPAEVMSLTNVAEDDRAVPAPVPSFSVSDVPEVQTSV
jgi:hypothetical protein